MRLYAQQAAQSISGRAPQDDKTTSQSLGTRRAEYACRSLMSGARYARVLPDPVGAFTSASRPASCTGMAARCILVGLL